MPFYWYIFHSQVVSAVNQDTFLASFHSTLLSISAGWLGRLYPENTSYRDTVFRIITPPRCFKYMISGGFWWHFISKYENNRFRVNLLLFYETVFRQWFSTSREAQNFSAGWTWLKKSSLCSTIQTTRIWILFSWATYSNSSTYLFILLLHEFVTDWHRLRRSLPRRIQTQLLPVYVFVDRPLSRTKWFVFGRFFRNSVVDLLSAMYLFFLFHRN